MSQSTFSAIILAAGQGKRMASPLPKILHPVAGQPMVHRVIQAVRQAGAREIRAVVGFGENLVRPSIEPLGVVCFRQHNQLGTADAVRSAQIESLEGEVLILNSDHPLIEAKDLERILSEFRASKASVAVVTAEMKVPGSLGRIVRHMGSLKAIVEAKDASADTLKIKEVNSGIYVTRSETLKKFLPMIQNFNAQKEFYLTDLVSLALENGEKVEAIKAPSRVAFGVNTQVELAKASQKIFRRKALDLLEKGVIVIDPHATYVEPDVEIGFGSVIYSGVFIRGQTKIGAFCVLEPHVFVSKSRVGDSVQIRAGSYLEDVTIDNGALIGPYARLRPETHIGTEAHVGNFVEMKKVKFGARAKANHLTYLGDAEVGEETNIGCGTITCNYAVDRKKYITKIGKGVFVGSDSQFIAPVEIGDHAVIGSGSTITKDVPAYSLGVARSKQFTKENYVAKPAQDITDKDKNKEEK